MALIMVQRIAAHHRAAGLSEGRRRFRSPMPGDPVLRDVNDRIEELQRTGFRMRGDDGFLWTCAVHHACGPVLSTIFVRTLAA